MSTIFRLLGKFALILPFMLASCTPGDAENEILEDYETGLNPNNAVIKEEAVLAAGNFIASNGLGVGITRGNGESTVSVITDNDGNAIAYIVNTDGAGWTIVGASRNYHPILAYSDSADAFIEYPLTNEGFQIWLSEIEDVYRRNSTADETELAGYETEWKAILEGAETMAVPTPPGGNSEEAALCRARLKELNDRYYKDGWVFKTLPQVTEITVPASVYANAQQYGSPQEYTIVGIRDESVYTNIPAMLSTAWGQQRGFESQCPGPFAGCVPVAMGQLMKYFEHPSYFDWGSMADSFKTDAAAELLYQIGNKIGADYGDKGTSANYQDALKGFKAFGYNATLKDHNSEDVWRYILSHCPVYMRGQKGLLQGGHAWVCDGIIRNLAEFQYYIEYLKCSQWYDNLGETLLENPGRVGGSSYTRLHMNWGWYGDYNGWFVDAKATAEDDFYYGRKNIYVQPIR